VIARDGSSWRDACEGHRAMGKSRLQVRETWVAAGDEAGVRVSVAEVEGCLQRVEAVVARQGLGPMAACRAASGREPGPPPEASGKEGSRRAREYLLTEEGQAWQKRNRGLLEGAGSSARGRRRRGTPSGRTRSGPPSGPR